MRALRIIVILFVVYAGVVITFESLIGYLQPAGETTLVITTTDADGSSNDRVLSHLESNGELFVAANHWPRAWYNRALEDPNVQASVNGQKRNYLAVVASPEEHQRVESENPLPTTFRVLTGFPPRYFLRLDPR